jgi:hypothetical protein
MPRHFSEVIAGAHLGPAERILYVRLITPVHVDLNSKGFQVESNRDLQQISRCRESEGGVQYCFAGEKE